VIGLLRAFGCRVLVSDPFLSQDQAAALSVELADLHTLIPQVDILSLHAPVLPETVGMIGARELALLRNDGLFMNTARAALVDESALLAELQSGRIHAVLDVFQEEPLPERSPFRALSNVLLTPHSAGHSVDTHWRQGEAMVAEVSRYLANEQLMHEVTSRMLESMA
jgi:phosphoglycerate dehydrogenase-like enzyme